MSRAFKAFIFCYIVLAAASSLFAEESLDKSKDYLFNQANNFYEQEKYDDAIVEYNKILAAGLESGNIYYNLGNCFFKKGDLGKAILNYERARKLIPRDRDLEANYKYAQAFIKRTTDQAAKLWIWRLTDAFFSQFTLNGLTLFVFMMYLLITIVIVLIVILKPPRGYTTGILAVMALVFIVSAGNLMNKAGLIGREAVVMSENTEARFEPFDRATAHFTLYEGVKVVVIESKGDWRKVRREDDKVGWVKSADIERI